MLLGCRHDFDGLIAVGGDGTINEVVSGMDLNKQTLAIVPLVRAIPWHGT